MAVTPTPLTIPTIKLAIVDYGVDTAEGTDYVESIRQACTQVGYNPTVTSCEKEILEAHAVILSGAGSYGAAMDRLYDLDLVATLRYLSQSLRPLLATNLGMQLLMRESYESGRHEGLGIVDGPVVEFNSPCDDNGPLPKIHNALTAIHPNRSIIAGRDAKRAGFEPWSTTPLVEVTEGAEVVFNHAYHCRPVNPSVVLSNSQYGQIGFCSALRYGNTFGCQFQPEKSGAEGLKVFKDFADIVIRHQATGKRRRAS